MDKKRILFVCLGNICRSPAAEAVMNRLVEERGLSGELEIDSAGLYGGHAGQLPDPRMRKHAGRRGYSFTHRARPVVDDDYDRFDLIVGMDGSNLRTLRSLAPSPEAERKVVAMMDYASPASRRHYDYVPDPYYEGTEGFELVLDLLEDACAGLLDSIEKGLPS